jgi:hypothetical protein
MMIIVQKLIPNAMPRALEVMIRHEEEVERRFQIEIAYR